eukprot:UN23447
MSESRPKTLIMNRNGSLRPELEKMRATRHLKAEGPYFLFQNILSDHLSLLK